MHGRLMTAMTPAKTQPNLLPWTRTGRRAREEHPSTCTVRWLGQLPTFRTTTRLTGRNFGGVRTAVLPPHRHLIRDVRSGCDIIAHPAFAGASQHTDNAGKLTGFVETLPSCCRKGPGPERARVRMFFDFEHTAEVYLGSADLSNHNSTHWPQLQMFEHLYHWRFAPLFEHRHLLREGRACCEINCAPGLRWRISAYRQRGGTHWFC